MNERIDELAEQCWENVPCLPYWVGIAGKRELLSTEKVFSKEKFAELIVKECAEIADDGFASSNFGNGITGHQLLKHFGVEE